MGLEEGKRLYISDPKRGRGLRRDGSGKGIKNRRRRVFDGWCQCFLSRSQLYIERRWVEVVKGLERTVRFVCLGICEEGEIKAFGKDESRTDRKQSKPRKPRTGNSHPSQLSGFLWLYREITCPYVNSRILPGICLYG